MCVCVCVFVFPSIQSVLSKKLVCACARIWTPTVILAESDPYASFSSRVAPVQHAVLVIPMETVLSEGVRGRTTEAWFETRTPTRQHLSVARDFMYCEESGLLFVGAVDRVLGEWVLHTHDLPIAVKKKFVGKHTFLCSGSLCACMSELVFSFPFLVLACFLSLPYLWLTWHPTGALSITPLQ